MANKKTFNGLIDTLANHAVETKIPVLQHNEILVCYLHIPSMRSQLPDIERCLDASEMTRAHKYHYADLSENFILRRAFLRKLIAAQLNIQPEDVHFQTNKQGKLSLDPTFHTHSLQFNLSHSGNFAVYACSPNITIGIDVEKIQPNIVNDALAQHIFSNQEFDTFKKLTNTQQCDAFFNTWAQKEAFIKAIGEGLSFPLQNFSVLITEQNKAKLTALESNIYKLNQWNITHIPMLPGYRAALSTQLNTLSSASIRYFVWC